MLKQHHPDTLLLIVGAVSIVLMLGGWIVGAQTQTSAPSTGLAVLDTSTQSNHSLGVIFLSIGVSMIASLLTTSLVLYFKTGDSKPKRH